MGNYLPLFAKYVLHICMYYTLEHLLHFFVIILPFEFHSLEDCIQHGDLWYKRITSTLQLWFNPPTLLTLFSQLKNKNHKSISTGIYHIPGNHFDKLNLTDFVLDKILV